MADIPSWTEVIRKDIVPVATGSIITLVGVWLQSWLQSKSEAERVNTQLQHDANQRNKERQMGLRRDVFLAAAEAMGKQAEYINSFAKIDFDYWKDQEAIKGSPATLNKLCLIAGIETIECYTAASLVTAQVGLKLSRKRLVVEKVKAEIKATEDLIAFWSKESGEAVVAMKALVEHPESNQGKYDSYKDRFEYLQSEIDKAFHKKIDLQFQLTEFLIAISEDCILAQIELAQKLVELNLAARKEVELPIDEERFRRFEEDVSKKLLASAIEYKRELTEYLAAEKSKAQSEA